MSNSTPDQVMIYKGMIANFEGLKDKAQKDLEQAQHAIEVAEKQIAEFKHKIVELGGTP